MAEVIIPDVNLSLKEALHDALKGILSSDQGMRSAAEQRLEALELTEEYGVYLAQLTINFEKESTLRQLSSIILKRYIDSHWSTLSETFRPPEVSAQAKVLIKGILPHGLKESSSKVQSSIAYAISAIAHWDWPENWPDFFEILMNYLSSDSEHIVQGAMKVLLEISQDVTDTQLTYVAPVIMSEMYRILENEQKYNLLTRRRAVEVFSSCTELITSSSSTNKKNILIPVLPSYCMQFVNFLSKTDGSSSDVSLKSEIMKALALLLRGTPKQMTTWLPQLLPTLWHLLTCCAEEYLTTVVNDPEGSNRADISVDSDGVTRDIQRLIHNVFDFIGMMVDNSKFRPHVKEVLSDLMHCLIVFMEISQQMECSWTADATRFVEDTSDDKFSYSVRADAQDILLILFERWEEESSIALSEACIRHIRESSTLTPEDPNWWKIHEACMYAVGSAKELVVKKKECGNSNYNLSGFLQNVVLSDLNRPAPPLLLGQCILVGSRYVQFMSPPMIQQFLEATLNGLQPTQHHIIRLYALRAVYGFCEDLKGSSNAQLLKSVLPTFLDYVLGMSCLPSNEVLGLVLETLAVLITVDEIFTAMWSEKVVTFSVRAFLKHNSDPSIISLCRDVFKVLSQNRECSAALQEKLIPSLITILNAPGDSIATGLHSVALEIVQMLVWYSTPPLSDILISAAFPAVCHCIGQTGDISAIVVGGECLRAFISISPQQIWNYQDNEGKTGLWLVLKVATMLLDPTSPECSAASTGRLLITLISKASDMLGENLDNILKAILCKLQRAETLDGSQGLLLVFAHLINTQFDAVLNFLSTLPGPSGESALHFVLTEWCSKQQYFCGKFDRKVSTMALSKLLHHGITNNDPRLSNINVKGDQVFALGSTMPKTRSQTCGTVEQWTDIPVLAKIFKLLINELKSAVDAEVLETGTDEETEEDWSEEEDIDKPETTAEKRSVSVSSIEERESMSDGNDEEEEEEEDDDAPELMKDSQYDFNLKEFLTDFLKSICIFPGFHLFARYLTRQEVDILNSNGVPHAYCLQ